MEPSQSLPELVAASQARAQTSRDRIAEIRTAMNGPDGSDAQLEDLTAATNAIELAAVDIFAVFEVRMQHHFKRGPLSRKLKAVLLAAGKADLADRVHQYYLAVNVLKHGTGASHRELLNNKSSLLTVKPVDDSTGPAAGLVDVTVPDFFEGLTSTLLEAYQFLENR